MAGFLVLTVAYASMAVFLLVAAWRTFRMARLPVHLRWELAPVPHEKGKSHYGGSYFEEFEWWTKPAERSVVSELAYMFQEIVFLKAVWEHNRRLWWFSFPFHFGMYLLIVSAFIVLVAAGLGLSGVTVFQTAGLAVATRILASVGFLLAGIGAVGLLYSRLTDPSLRAFRTTGAVFNLLFLLAVFVSGAYALITLEAIEQQLTGVVQALLTADASVNVRGSLTVHLMLGFLFLAYLPFTRMLHFVAKYFTYHRVRWDDGAMNPQSGMEQEVLRLLKQPVTWSGAHLGTDGKKNWVDIATGEIEE